jgi:hypothetical protein
MATAPKKQDVAKTGDKDNDETVVDVAVDKTATEPAVPDDADVAAPSHDSEALKRARDGVDPVDDPSIPKRNPDGNSPNESPEIALSLVEIPAHNSNEQLGVAAAKRARAERDGTPDEPQGRKSPSKHNAR